MEYFDKDDPCRRMGPHKLITNLDQTENKFLLLMVKNIPEGLPDMEWKDGKVVG